MNEKEQIKNVINLIFAEMTPKSLLKSLDWLIIFLMYNVMKIITPTVNLFIQNCRFIYSYRLLILVLGSPITGLTTSQPTHLAEENLPNMERGESRFSPTTEILLNSLKSH